MVLSLPGRLVLASHVLPKIFDNMGHLSYCITFEFASQVVLVISAPKHPCKP